MINIYNNKQIYKVLLNNNPLKFGISKQILKVNQLSNLRNFVTYSNHSKELFSKLQSKKNYSTSLLFKENRIHINNYSQILSPVPPLIQKKMVSKIPTPTVPSLLDWSFTPKKLEELTDKLINEGKEIEKKIENIPDDQCTFENVIVPIGQKMENEVEALYSNIDFFQHISTDKDLRDASSKCSLKLEEYDIERSMNKKIYQKVTKVVENINSGKFKALENPEDKRLLEKLELNFRRNGLALPDDKLEKLKELKKKLSGVCIDFSRNISEDKTTYVFTKKELVGLPDDFFENLEKTTKDGEEAYVVDMKYPCYFPIIKLAQNEETRKQMMLVNGQRCKMNLDLLKEAVNIR